MQYDGETVKQWAGTSQWRAWRADLARFRKHGYSGWGSEGFWVLTIYRMQHAAIHARHRWLWWPARIILAVAKKLLTAITHINLDPRAHIGPGLLIPHVGPIQVFPLASIGADCAIHQVCTIGAGGRPGGPVIGDHVMIGCHTCVLGPVYVGDGARIGAGAVVVTDIPAGATAVGVPARPLGPNLRQSPAVEDCPQIAL
ncbi:serine O-acetyltransferase [Fontivita pretiosa]|uniref:serine O-acetyltransferase n=1 Tax=Fontivita pretiosa TaxID=2989684 RepID=UPI003D16C318